MKLGTEAQPLQLLAYVWMLCTEICTYGQKFGPLPITLLHCTNPERQVSVAVLLDSFVAASLELEGERFAAESSASGNRIGYATDNQLQFQYI